MSCNHGHQNNNRASLIWSAQWNGARSEEMFSRDPYCSRTFLPKILCFVCISSKNCRTSLQLILFILYTAYDKGNAYRVKGKTMKAIVYRLVEIHCDGNLTLCPNVPKTDNTEMGQKVPSYLAQWTYYHVLVHNLQIFKDINVNKIISPARFH